MTGELTARGAVDWLDATRDLKAIRKKERAKSAWARLFSKSRASEAAKLKEAAGNASYEQIRKARVRLDITCMVLFQSYISLFNFDFLDIFLFTDGSPQWRGLELIASSFDMVDLGIAPYTTQGKTAPNA